jgi:hypothetical protein
MSLKEGFNSLLSIHRRSATISRPGGSSGTIYITPSNYYRHLEGPSETVISGHEFVIAKTDLDAITWGKPKRGDRLVDAALGDLAISEIREMFGIGGEILGYRVRTS